MWPILHYLHYIYNHILNEQIILRTWISWYIGGIKFIFLKFFSWLIDLSQYNAGITFKFHNFIQVIPFTINVTNIIVPAFTWFNMYGMKYWTWNQFFFNIILFQSKILLQYDVSIIFLLGFGRVMQYPSMFQNICYGD
jgi:hypothetical protein